LQYLKYYYKQLLSQAKKPIYTRISKQPNTLYKEHERRQLMTLKIPVFIHSKHV